MLQKQLFPSRIFLFFLITFKLENVKKQEEEVPLYESVTFWSERVEACVFTEHAPIHIFLHTFH